MLVLIEKLLFLSIRMDQSRFRLVRLFGDILGAFPVWYSSRLEKKLFSGTWDPLKGYKKRLKRKMRRQKRKLMHHIKSGREG